MQRSCVELGLRAILATVGLVTLGSAQENARIGVPYTMEDISAAYEKRAGRISSFSMSASIRESRYGESFSAGYSLDRRFEIVSQGGSKRTDMGGDVPVMVRGGNSPPSYTERSTAFHDGVFRRFLPLASTQPRGVVDIGVGVHGGHEMQIITMSLGEGLTLGGRSLESLSILDVRNTPRGEIVVVGNTDYMTAETARGRGNISAYEFHLDPSMDYLPVGYEVFRSLGQRSRAGTLEYELDPEIGFRPVGGTMTSFNPETQEVLSDVVVTVEDLAINISIPEWRFIVDFPEGTSVVDNIAGIKYTMGLDDPETLARMATPWPSPPPPESGPAQSSSPPPPIRIDPVVTADPADNFIRIGFGLTLFITGLAFLFLYRSMKK